MMTGVLRVFFGWPEGGVWSNLLAALLWSPLAGAALTLHHVLMRRHHTKTAAEQTQQLKDHIDATLGTAPQPTEGHSR